MIKNGVFLFPSHYRANRVPLCRTGIQERKTWTRRIQNSGGYNGGCRRRPVWLWRWPVPWPACRWRWRDKFSYTAGPPWQTWSVTQESKNSAALGYPRCSYHKGLQKNIPLHLTLFLYSSGHICHTSVRV